MLFKIMGKKGDAAVAYDLETAEMKFNELKESNLIPFERAKPEGPIKKNDNFNPDAHEVIWFPRIGGG